MVLLFGPFPVENVNWLGFRWELNLREREREREFFHFSHGLHERELGRVWVSNDNLGYSLKIVLNDSFSIKSIFDSKRWFLL